MDVCVVIYHNTTERIEPALRPTDTLFVRDNARSNIGFGRAQNELAARGQHPLILILNPDGDPQPGCIDALERRFDDPEVVAAEARQGPAFSTCTRGRLSWACAARLVVRRFDFEAVGGFDETLFLYYEDVDLSWKLAQRGRIEHCDDAVFLHDQDSRGGRAAYYTWRNEIIVKKRWGKPIDMKQAWRDVGTYVAKGRLGRASVKTAALLVGLAKSRRQSRCRLGGGAGGKPAAS